tara:strand:+ start:437 stop:628 length:192 start_codon:yes stop_codon:yes gene_type:complete
MKISEIKNKELRELAELRKLQFKDNDLYRSDDDNLGFAFEWSKTNEGCIFWTNVCNGTITRIK